MPTKKKTDAISDQKTHHHGFKLFWALILSIVLAQLAGIIGSFFTISTIPTWYTQIIKPDWNPPNWLFGPVWTSLYALMGIAAFLVWQEKGNHDASKKALIFYGIQLALNALWSIIFFGLKDIGLALGEIALLWVSILVVLIQFWKINRYAGYLFVPYLLWVTFAAFLNYTLWTLN